MTTDRFHADLLNSQLCAPPNELDSASVDWLQDVYNTSSLWLDKHAARRTVQRRHQPTTPWFVSMLLPRIEFGCSSVATVELLLLLTDMTGSWKSGGGSDCT